MEEVKFIFSMDDQFSAAAKKAEGATAGLTNRMDKLGSVVAGAMSIGAVVSFEKAAIGAYMKMEGYESRMTTLLHSREAALKAIDNIVVDAAKTPFDLDSLIQSNSMLIGSGVSAVGARQAVMDLGNAIAATGGGSDELARMSVNLAQIKSIGKASALDVKQFMYANIPIYEMLSKSMHKNVNEIKEMDISYKDLTKALSDARKEGGMFYEGLENANKTLTGSVSNLGDAWDQLMTSIGRSQSGILKSTVSWANSMLNEMNKAIKDDSKMTGAFKKGGAQEYSMLEKAGSGVGKDNTYLRDAQLSMMVNKMTENMGANELSIAKGQQMLSSMVNKLLDNYDKGMVSPIDFNRQMAILKAGKSDLSTSFGQIQIDKNKKKEEVALMGKKDKEATKVKQQQYTNITINIDEMIGVNKLETKGGEKQIGQDVGEIILRNMTEAVEDSQIVAGI